jgi:hypothetical protein
MEKKTLIKDLKQAQKLVKNVHQCPSCMTHLEAIKQHQRQGHQ